MADRICSVKELFLRESTEKHGDEWIEVRMRSATSVAELVRSEQSVGLRKATTDPKTIR